MPNHPPVDADLLHAWVKGWSLTRNVSAPTIHDDGFRVDVGWPNQKVRYVYPSLSGSFITLANTIHEPWHYLKACVTAEEMRNVLPATWVLQSPRYLMTLFSATAQTRKALPEGYRITIVKEGAALVTIILAPDGMTAAIGRIVFADGYAIYDRIETNPAHRRQGLASIVMQCLQTWALDHNIDRHLLVATEEGKLLYESLGWNMLSPYSTAVIPG